jgi:hypothetical protein
VSPFVFVVEDTIEIAAPVSVVFEVLTNKDAWPTWSSMLVSRAPGPVTLGAPLALGLRTPEASYDFVGIVTELVHDASFEWLAKTGVSGVMDGRHRFDVTALSPERSHLRNVERYSGLLVPFARRTASMRAAPAGFRKMNEELARRAEQLASQR